METYDIYPDGCYSCDENAGLTMDDMQKIADEFEANGYFVEVKAIEHNYEAWCRDEKSGYKDETNDVFLFSPCGCNRLRFSASHLTGAEYEKTYSA